MTLKDQILEDYHIAYKSQSSDKLSLSILVGEIQRLKNKDLSDAEVIKLLKGLLSQENDRIKFGGAQDEKYSKIINSYLPLEVSDEEIIEYIKEAINFTMFKNKMQSMKQIVAQFPGVDGQRIKNIIETKF